jgi:uncharacterized phage protein gp47/JayE
LPDLFDANGLTIKTLTELVDEGTTDFQDIYGDDINIASDTPDGQIINIQAQAGVDQRELLEKINASFDPDQAEGVVLDQRIAINGLTRNAGSFTFQNIEIITNKALSLIGLDTQIADINPIGNIYTVKDDEGNLFYLVESQAMTGAGTFSFAFRAANIGLVQVLPNTITTVVTVISGVVSVNNPDAVTSLGIDEESDYAVKNRRRASTSINNIANVDGLQAALANITGVTVAKVYENDTRFIDANGQIANSIWCIVEGGDPDDIAAAIYAKKTMGCATVGSEEVIVTRADGREKIIRYDIPETENIYIRFAISGDVVDEDYLKNSIVDNLFWEIGLGAAGSTVTSYLVSLNSRYKITQMELSADGMAWSETLDIAAITNRFVNALARITIL